MKTTLVVLLIFCAVSDGSTGHSDSDDEDGGLLHLGILKTGKYGDGSRSASESDDEDGTSAHMGIFKTWKLGGVCKSGPSMKTCSPIETCDRGYVCKFGWCCAVCPKGREYGGRCNVTPGKPRCQFGYDCSPINNLCCDVKRRCPTWGKTNRCVVEKKKRRLQCFSSKQCAKGMLCCKDVCGRVRFCTKGVMVV